MRPEHSETKAKAETRECETEKSVMRPRPRPRAVQSSQLFYFLLHTWGEWWTGNGVCI